jgi:uncharacterized protein YcnI
LACRPRSRHPPIVADASRAPGNQAAPGDDYLAGTDPVNGRGEVVMRRALVLVGMVVGVLASAGPAGAHVTIQPGEASQGGFSTEIFQVPNESDTASTVRVEVTFPEEYPIPFVSVEPVPGWQVDVERTSLDQPISGEGEDITEAVSKITWSGGQIGPGQFQRFPVSMGPLPEDADTLLFPAVQVYSDGEEVRWIEPVPASGEEPERPAPTLTLVAGGNGHGGAAADAEAVDDESAAADDHDTATASDVDSAKTIGIIGIVVGALGVILAIVALVRKPKVSS